MIKCATWVLAAAMLCVVGVPSSPQGRASASLSGLGYAGMVWPTATAPTPSLSINYANTKYTLPSTTFTGCGTPSQWSYLTASCYNTLQRTCGTGTDICPTTAKDLIAQDLAYMKNNGLGTFTKVVVSIDQLFNRSKWNNTTGFGGFDAQALANFDDMLHTAAGLNMKLGLILYQYDNGIANEFHPEALDGNHPQMRDNYLAALGQLMSHVAADPQDMAAIAVVDLQGEGYYQLDSYFASGTTNTTSLGRWNYLEPAWDPTSGSLYMQCLTPGNTQCTGGADQHGCVTSSSHIDTTCVNVNIVYPWLKDLYTTAKAAAPRLLYTVSDAGGSILTTNPSGNYFTSQSFFLSLYQYTDVYEVHLYDNDPGSAANLARYQTAAHLTKPWFIGEAGCATGNSSCTYDGTNPQTLSIDSWWLDNMKTYGAQAVEVEQYGSTAVTYPNGYGSQLLSPVGFKIKTLNASASTPTPIPTDSPTRTPTTSPTNLPAATRTPTSTVTQTSLASPTRIASATATRNPSATAMAPTSTPTGIVAATSTSTVVGSHRPTSTPSGVPTSTATAVATVTTTATPVPIDTATSSAAATTTATPVVTAATPSGTATPDKTPLSARCPAGALRIDKHSPPVRYASGQKRGQAQIVTIRNPVEVCVRGLRRGERITLTAILYRRSVPPRARKPHDPYGRVGVLFRRVIYTRADGYGQAIVRLRLQGRKWPAMAPLLISVRAQRWITSRYVIVILHPVRCAASVDWAPPSCITHGPAKRAPAHA